MREVYGLLYKLKRNDINSNLLKIIEKLPLEMLDSCTKWATSKWNEIKDGFSQGSMISSHFFLTYINDLQSEIPIFTC